MVNRENFYDIILIHRPTLCLSSTKSYETLTFLVQFFHESLEVAHAAIDFINGSVIDDIVTGMITHVRWVEGVHPQCSDVQVLLKIVQLLDYACKMINNKFLCQYVTVV